jgi:uncharacterized protein
MRLFDACTSFGLPTVPGVRYARTATDLLAAMDRVGIARALVLHQALKTEDPEWGNDITVRECAVSDRLVPTWALAPAQTGESPAPDELLARMGRAGVPALWAFPAIHRYRLDALTFGALFEAMSARRVPLFVSLEELGGTDAGWGPVAGLLDDFPELTLVLTGHGCWGCDRYFRPLVEAYPNLHLDIARFELDQGIALFTERYGPERLVFSTAYPQWAEGGPIEMLARAPIADEARALIASGNLERLLGWAGTDTRADSAGAEPPEPEGLAYPVVDCHAHFGPYTRIWFPTRTTADMLHTMDRVNVRVAICSHHTGLVGETPYGNQRLQEDALEPEPARFLGYTVWNPHLAAEQERDLETWPPHEGFVGFKIHPSLHDVAMTDARYEPVLAYANAHRLPVLSHTWGHSGVDGPSCVGAVAEAYPDLQLLLGHSLFGQWDEAVRLAGIYPNLWLELCASYAVGGVIEKLVEGVGSERVLYGTDLPWFDPMYAIGCVLHAEITEDDKRNILHRNAARLFPAVAARLQ